MPTQNIRRFEADIALTLSPGEATHLSDLEDQWYWTGWTRRLWPANVVRPGLHIYGFDTRPAPLGRRLCVLLEVTRGGSFSYTSKATFARQAKELTGWEPGRIDPHFKRIPSGSTSRPCTGIALRWRVVKEVSFPLDGRFPQIGWRKLVQADAMKVIEIDGSDLYDEGQRVLRRHLAIERNPRLRADSKAYWQVKLRGRVHCLACHFDFRTAYGDHGEGFIEMHHLKPLAEQIDPRKCKVTDLVPVCSNCHRMIHRDPLSALSIADLRVILRRSRTR